MENLQALGFSPAALGKFTTRANVTELHGALVRSLRDDPVAQMRARRFFPMLMQNYVARLRRAGHDSVFAITPGHTTDLGRIPVEVLNDEFLRGAELTLRNESRAPCTDSFRFDYVPDTDVPRAICEYPRRQTSDEVLASWRRKSARLGQMADDDDFRTTAAAVPLVYYYDNPDAANTNRHEQEFDLNDPEMYGPIDNDLNVGRKNEALWFRRLNQNLYESTPIGYDNPQATARLMSRNIFRRGVGGIPNAVPQREVNLVRRNFDRNIDETLRGPSERCGKVLGYDMAPLRRMTAAKKGPSSWPPLQ